MTPILKIIFSGIAATAAMTMVMLLAPYMGMPKMNVAEMLSAMIHTPLLVGWLMHFMIGIFYAFVFAYYVNTWLHRINNSILRGLLFGFIVFVIAQIMLPIMMMIMPPPDMPFPQNQNMMLIVVGSLIGHLVYGGVLGVFDVKEVATAKSFA